MPGILFKIMKNAFYFTSKALFVFKMFKFLSWLLVMYQNDLIRKIRLILIFLALQRGWETLEIHILPNISINKGNHTTKFGQLIEYNMRHIFIEKSSIKRIKLGPDSFLENENQAYLLINNLKLSTVF